jgi:hypothetical protein
MSQQMNWSASGARSKKSVVEIPHTNALAGHSSEYFAKKSRWACVPDKRTSRTYCRRIMNRTTATATALSVHTVRATDTLSS